MLLLVEGVGGLVGRGEAGAEDIGDEEDVGGDERNEEGANHHAQRQERHEAPRAQNAATGKCLSESERECV